MDKIDRKRLVHAQHNTAEKTMNSLGELTASRKDWKRIVKDIMAENR